ncbi:MAG: acyl-CoA dehydrogenase family protein [Pseudomonadota bacterium]|jgi:alkylation response protein AidB-like acyl-CoA dehydrogenase|nr:acyl-CoA dehydrogenase family protein [Pseudomonadota bacterium]
MVELTQFRKDTRAWLEQHCPPTMRTRPKSDEETVWGGRRAQYPNDEAKTWLDAMASKGWTCPTWPSVYGGGGLSANENQVLQEELASLNARPPLISFGISMLGPVLLEYGNEQQKLEHLPKIVKGEIRWCQGYSEPGSGSDLASLQTRAVLEGDHYTINGSKIWTSFADKSDWIFCLVRTDPQASKHMGISFILFDMESEGVSAKPIKLISGASVFCETFFNDVVVPKSNLIGDVNSGWTIAKKLLQHERNMISGMGTRGKSNPKHSLANQAKQYLGEVNHKIADSNLRDQVTQFNLNSRAFGLTLQRASAESKSRGAASPASSMFKLYGTEQNKKRYELLLKIMGSQGIGWESEAFSERELSVAREWLRSRANSIEGGTSEVQLNVIAKQVLKLPD